ncbi:MAG: toll/interleukin-1 receptor domain-containing protein [bacterium]|nr:toll/interleukin-1 receptor domain-containing protein [bacterium]
MKVMICWSGDRSKAAAEALREWLPSVLHGVAPWMSEHDLDAGSRWGKNLDESLGATGFGILCLTPAALHADWLLFEAGALSKRIETSRVVPYLIGLQASQVPYPLAQFQMAPANQPGTFKLLQSINRIREEALRLTDERLRETAEVWWPKLKPRLAALPEDSGEGVPVARDAAEVQEEILSTLRGMSKSISVQGKELAEFREAYDTEIVWIPPNAAPGPRAHREGPKKPSTAPPQASAPPPQKFALATCDYVLPDGMHCGERAIEIERDARGRPTYRCARHEAAASGMIGVQDHP